MNRRVSFELAKLLKEKKFNKATSYYYNEGKCLCGGFPCAPQNHNKLTSVIVYSAPTIADVVMWLCEKHRLDIIVRYPDSNTNKIEGINSVYYDIEVYWLSGGDAWKKYKGIGVSDDKTEAYEAAIEYTLKKLI